MPRWRANIVRISGGSSLFVDHRLGRLLILDEICGDRRSLWSGFSGDFQQTQQVLRLFFVQVNELNTKTDSVAVMPDFTFEIKPITVRKHYAKGDDLANHYLAHGIEVTAAFGEIGDACGMSFLAAMPHRIEMNAQSGFRSSIVHELKPS